MKTAGNIVAIALACGSLAAASFVRIGSGPLNTSVQNERDAALDRATAWLVAHQSPEGFWGDTNVVATAAAALAIRGDRENLPKADAEAVEKAVRWLKSPACTNALYSIPPLTQESHIRINRGTFNTPRQRAIAWRWLASVVLAPPETSVPTNGPVLRDVVCFIDFDRQAIFDERVSSRLADALRIRLADLHDVEVCGSPSDPALAFIVATFVKPPPPAELRPLIGKLAAAWNDETIQTVWLDNPEAAWWLARSINRASGGNLTLPPDANGNVVDVNWRGITAGRWINSQRIDDAGNGHWDGDAEKTAFAALLLNEM